MYRVLLVDDEVWVVESLKTIIDWEAAGCRIIGQAYNGIEALDIIVKEAPDIVFTDIRMPDMNGLELIKKVMIWVWRLFSSWPAGTQSLHMRKKR